MCGDAEVFEFLCGMYESGNAKSRAKNKVLLLHFDLSGGVFSEVGCFPHNEKCILFSGKCKEYIL